MHVCYNGTLGKVPFKFHLKQSNRNDKNHLVPVVYVPTNNSPNERRHFVSYGLGMLFHNRFTYKLSIEL